MKPQAMRRLRQLHLYIGVFFTPAILFFAISGGLQTFRLQQASGWNGAAAPQWIAWMASVHTDQAKFVPKPEASKAKKPPLDAAKAAERAAHQKAVLPMKIFAVLLAAALSISALLGATIALNMRTTRRMSALMLVMGSVVPLILLA
jgi:hypothetical protein